MRHVYFRAGLALLWLVAAIVGAVSGRWKLMFLYMVLGGVFGYSAYTLWKKNKTVEEEGRDE